MLGVQMVFLAMIIICVLASIPLVLVLFYFGSNELNTYIEAYNMGQDLYGVYLYTVPLLLMPIAGIIGIGRIMYNKIKISRGRTLKERGNDNEN